MRASGRGFGAWLVLAVALSGCEAELDAGAADGAGDFGDAGDGGDAAGLLGGCAGRQDFLVGRGIYDITGPAAELGMMGYAQLEQKTAGIHTRLWARAFLFASPCNGKRLAFVSA